MGNQALQDMVKVYQNNITSNVMNKWNMTKEISFPKYVLMIYQYLCKKWKWRKRWQV